MNRISRAAVASVLLLSISAPLSAFALSYLPGQTLNPNCLPSDPTCVVIPNTTSGSFTATSSSATSTFAGNVQVAGVASSTNVVVSNTLIIGTLSGILKAINGVITSALVNLASDVTGVLSIINGGTGTSTVPTLGQILVGNGAGGYTLAATSSLGIIGSQWISNGSTVSYNGGNVGIGTTTPFTNFSVNGNGYFSGTLFGNVSSSTLVTPGTPFARTLSDRASDAVNIEDFGAKCDGVTNDTSALQTAATWVSAASNRSLNFPAGTCVFSNTIVFSLHAASILGAGIGATTLLYDGASTTIDLIRVGDGTNSDGPYNATVQGLSITSSTTMTGGYALHVIAASFSNFADIETNGYANVSNTLWNGIYFDQFDMVNVTNFRSTAQNDALDVSALGPNGSPKPQYDFYATHGKLGGAAVGLHVGGGVDNVFFDDMMITHNGINVEDDNTLEPYQNQEITFGPQVTNEYSTHDGYYINDSLCNPSTLGFVTINGKVILSGGSGINIKSFPNCQIIVNSPYISNNGNDGIHIADASAILSVSPSTQISNNTGFGINAEFPFQRLYSSGQLLDNTAGQYGPSVTTSNVGQTGTANIWTNSQTFYGSVYFGSTTASSILANGSLSLVANGLNVGGNQLSMISGNIGIGTTSPSALLDVFKNFNTQNSGYAASLVSVDTGVGITGIRAGHKISGGNLNPFEAWNNGAQIITVNSAGEVGIGTTSPQTLLGMQGGLGVVSNQLYLGANGFVGINTTNPQAPLDVENGLLRIQQQSATGPGSGGIDLYQDGAEQARIYPVGGGNLIFSTNTGVNERMRITGNGNVGIGTSTPYARLEVFGPDSASTSAFAVVNNASITEFSVFDTGNAVLAGGLTQNSDQRLKTNIQSLDGSSSLSLIDELNPVTFNWIDPNKGPTLQLGFIAQQVANIFPNLVSTTSPTTLTPDGTLSLNYIDLISPIVSAIQALDREITSLSATVANFAQSITSAVGNFGNLSASNELCVGATCVTPAQFQAIVAAANQSGVAQSSGSSTATTPPVIQINGANPALIEVGASYNDLGATITGPAADLNLDIATYVNGVPASPVTIDTSAAATDTIDYVVTDLNGLTSTSTRTVIIQAPIPVEATSSPAS